jgi:hypothetical protein
MLLLQECKTCQGETRQERDTAVERHSGKRHSRKRTAGKKHSRRETRRERQVMIETVTQERLHWVGQCRLGGVLLL